MLHLILDPVQLNCSAEVAVFVADRPWRFRVHWLPVHGSRLSFIEAWFAIFSAKCLERSEWAADEEAARDILAFIDTYNAHQAHPFSWRKGIKFYQRLKDKLAEKHSAESPLATAA